MSCLELLVRDIQTLYTDFSASRQEVLLTFRRFEIVVKLFPNSDSAEAVHNRFYYDPVRTLLLLAIAKALRLRFGLSIAPT